MLLKYFLSSRGLEDNVWCQSVSSLISSQTHVCSALYRNLENEEQHWRTARLQRKHLVCAATEAGEVACCHQVGQHCHGWDGHQARLGIWRQERPEREAGNGEAVSGVSRAGTTVAAGKVKVKESQVTRLQSLQWTADDPTTETELLGEYLRSEISQINPMTILLGNKNRKVLLEIE